MSTSPSGGDAVARPAKAPRPSRSQWLDAGQFEEFDPELEAAIRPTLVKVKADLRKPETCPRWMLVSPITDTMTILDEAGEPIACRPRKGGPR